MHSVSDLTTSLRQTSGDVPPKLVGASTTVVGDRMYLFGGRLVTERRMVADLYVLDLETFVWQRIPAQPDDDIPGPRYFHSTDAWNNQLVVFGGMGHKPEQATLPGQGDVNAQPTDDLCVLNDVRFFDLATRRWLPRAPTPGVARADSADPITSEHPNETSSTNPHTPRARYAHLSAVSGSRLFVIGGQDLNNLWLDDVCVFDFRARRWVARRPYPRHAGTYRSVAVAGALRVRVPAEETRGAVPGAAANGGTAAGVAGGPETELDKMLGPPGKRFAAGERPVSSKGGAEYTASESLVHLPYSAEPTDEFPCEIYLYSNYNFTDVKRELEVFTPLPTDSTPVDPANPATATASPSDTFDFHMTDRSSNMTGAVLPPGLRFPAGAICGSHLLFAGTYLAHSYQAFSIWALDLRTMAWTRLDPGAALAQGSWFRGVLWARPTGAGAESDDGMAGGAATGSETGSSKFIVFGNRGGNLVDDYNRRLLSWDDAAVLDLEAFGIYQPPRAALDTRAQALGLAALEEELLADFEVVCDDGRRIRCSRRVLEARWPWFREQRRRLLDAATRALESIPASSADIPAPAPASAVVMAGANASGDPIDGAGIYDNALVPAPEPVDPRLTPRALLLSEPYPITLALLQYFYSRALLTPLQHAPAVLSQLLLLSATYNLPYLQALVRHAMHRTLTMTPATSVGVYEVATLCGCQSLQIRALKAVMSSSRRAAGRNRGNSSGQGSGGGGSGSREGGDNHPSRPRGMSDLRGIARMDGGGAASTAATYGSDSGTVNGRNARVPPATQPEYASPIEPLSVNVFRARPKHSVNLSMDTLYRALNAAEEEEGGGMSDASARASSVSPPPLRRNRATSRSVDLDSDSEYLSQFRSGPSSASTGQELRHASPNPQLGQSAPARSPLFIHRTPNNSQSHGPGILRVGRPEERSLRAGAQIARMVSPPPPVRGRALPPDYDVHAVPLTIPEEREREHDLPRLGIPRANRHPHSDSDTPSLISSGSNTSVNSSVGSAPNQGQRRPEPASPEEPPLVTPLDPVGHGLRDIVPLSSIGEEGSVYEPTITRRIEPLDKEDTGTVGIGSRSSMFSNGRYERASSSFMALSVISSPATSTFPLTDHHPASRSPRSLASSLGISSRMLVSNKTLRAERDASKARAKAEKLEKKAQERALVDQREHEAATGGGGAEAIKAQRAEEKRRKKAEERARLERLAAELKVRKGRAENGSVYSSFSSEARRRAANEWVETSDGMYGVNGWGSL